MTSRRGFTLIELSIVLVIIGLLASGILVGRDLIEVAQIRAQVTQVERLNTAVHTFMNKYNGLPGDISAANAVAFGMAPRTGASGDGDNDGLIATCGGLDSSGVSGCEDVYFWSDLSVAQMIPGDFSADNNFPANPGGKDVGLFFPTGKVGINSYLLVFSHDNLNRFALIHPAYASDDRLLVTTSISAEQGFAIDTKMDDGLPTTGRVMGSAGDLADIYANPTSFHQGIVPLETCLLNGVPPIYDTKDADKTKPYCSMNFIFQ